MTGMDRWIDWKKEQFIGQAAAIKERDGNGPAQKLVMLEIDADNADASGYEPVWDNDSLVGFVTSGGYGHNVDKSLALAFVEPEFSEPGIELKTHIVGKEKRCVVLGNSPWDPEGSRMRL